MIVLYKIQFLNKNNLVFMTILQVEHFGVPIAWKVDSHLAILIKSDLHHLTELVLTSFMHESLSVNDGLRLVRIECKIFWNIFTLHL